MKPEFDRVAAAYAEFRVGYSPQTVATIVREAGSGGTVLDVATGTGLLADQLRPHVRRVVGIDLAHDMLRAATPPVVQGAAERLPFRDGAFDAVACAQAFHWVDRRRASVEFRRVIRPGGAIAILWKYPAPSEPYEPLASQVLVDLTGVAIKSGMAYPRLEELSAVQPQRFEWEIDYTVDRYVGWMASRESVRQRVGPHRERWLSEFRRRLQELVGDRPFRERNVDALFLTRR